nr:MULTISPECIES: hypothetical protein [unclassified Mesotoga]
MAYFPEVSLAEAYSDWIRKERLAHISVDPEISGYQLFVDDNDSFTGMEEIWLGQPTTLGISETLETVRDNGGVSVMAHIDRKMGLITQLGVIPEEYREVPMEISFRRTLFEGIESRNILHSSDAHSLNVIAPTVSLSANTRSFEEFRSAIFSFGRTLKIIWD